MNNINILSLDLVNKKVLISILAILSIASHEYTYAHGENRDDEKREAERKAEEEQKAKENWDKFMDAINKQKPEKNPDNN